MLSEAIDKMAQKRELRKEEKEEEKEQTVMIAKKRGRKSKEEGVVEEVPLEDQITINLNDSSSKRIKYQQDKENFVPSTKQTASTEENGLFKQEQQQKEEKTKEVLVLEHALTVEDEEYQFPSIDLLSEGKARSVKGGKKALADTASKLQKTLYSFGVSAKVENVSVGPAITRYEIKPAEGVRVSKIANLADDVAFKLSGRKYSVLKHQYQENKQ